MLTHRRSLVAAVAAFALVLSALPALAQAPGRVVFHVKDETGEPIQGVKITVTAQEFDFEELHETNKKGRATISIAPARRRAGAIPLERKRSTGGTAPGATQRHTVHRLNFRMKI